MLISLIFKKNHGVGMCSLSVFSVSSRAIGESLFKTPPKRNFQRSVVLPGDVFFPAEKMLAQCVPQLKGQQISKFLCELDEIELRYLDYEESSLRSTLGGDICYETSFQVTKTAGSASLIVAPFFLFSPVVAGVVGLVAVPIYDYWISSMKAGQTQNDLDEVAQLAKYRIERAQKKIRLIESRIEESRAAISLTQSSIASARNAITYAEWALSFFTHVDAVNRVTEKESYLRAELVELQEEAMQLRVAKAFFSLQLKIYLAKKTKLLKKMQ